MNDQVAKSVDEANDLVTSATERVADLAGKTQTAVGQGIRTIRDSAVETGKQVSDAAAKAHQQGTQAADYVRRRTTEQPLTALLLAGAIGYGIAYLVHAQVGKDRN
jgi:ElaB/YqjD/DUF883 family membrane-anchored ribosome-binding protein